MLSPMPRTLGSPALRAQVEAQPAPEMGGKPPECCCFFAFLTCERGLLLLVVLAYMAKPLTKSQIAANIAETVGITKKQATEALQTLVEMAYKNAKNTFTIPGLGKLVLVNRKARMGRNPATGEQIKIAAKRVVKFRVAKAAKDSILGSK